MAGPLPFLRASWNIATLSLPPDGWHGFKDLSGFPADDTNETKLFFVSDTLRVALAPRDVRANPNLRHERIRTDLNKYHNWLLHIALRDMLEFDRAKKTGRLPASIPQVTLPEDLPKIVDDLYLFHKHHAEIAALHGHPDNGTIQHYRTLNGLSRAVERFRAPPSPLRADERDTAFRNHISEHGGDGAATLHATLPNGTILVQVATEQASRSFGSPHWCTAYRSGMTWFDEYKDNLLIVVDPDGRRYQIHFGTAQVRDGNDNQVSLADIAADRPGLDRALLPFLKTALKASTPYDFVTTLSTCKDIRLFEEEVKNAGFIQRTIAGTSEAQTFIRACLRHPAYERILAQPDGIRSALNIHMERGWIYSCIDILETCQPSETLVNALTHPDGIARTLKNHMLSNLGNRNLLNRCLLLAACREHVPYALATLQPHGFDAAITTLEEWSSDGLRSDTDDARARLTEVKRLRRNMTGWANNRDIPVPRHRGAVPLP